MPQGSNPTLSDHLDVFDEWSAPSCQHDKKPNMLTSNVPEKSVSSAPLTVLSPVITERTTVSSAVHLWKKGFARRIIRHPTFYDL